MGEVKGRQTRKEDTMVSMMKEEGDWTKVETA